MEFGATNLAMPHHVSLLSALESFADIRERGRNRFSPCRDACDEELVCPKPRRFAVGMSSAPLETFSKPFRRLRGTTCLPADGEAGHEILDILSRKVNCGESGGFGSPNGYLSGSPPQRAGNPIIHDVHFIQKRASSSSVAIPQKSSYSSSSQGGNTAKSNTSVKSSSCSTSYGSNPFVRIEGFASAALDSNQGVPAYA